MVRRGNEDAVSPVIGVMLMIVVTIIIAATVSAFSTGFVSDTHTAPQTQVAYVGVLTGPIDGLGEIGLVFENKGGETLLLSDLELHLKSTMAGGDEASIAYADAPSETYREVTAPNEVRLSEDFTYRMKKVGVLNDVRNATTVANSKIKAGDRFIIHADRYITNGDSTYGRVAYVADRRGLGAPPGAPPYSSGEFEVSGRTAYTLIDRNTGTAISSGTLVGSVL
ncbi:MULTISPECIES: type IV pilin N-terminal domain-containing protein [unclassified Methanoculleus]|jgi:FlaG/FlaF family flagellin (archaellin)|uniref:Type IV pilin N-terminal domain-containing protein n=1 Tax=Methanoculleus palmolei TaxID=72612 RepID=A0ABD8A719_9EURY|nr:type IV pilin N-terminal domain-containing protein [Methanoculleus sp. UBA377]MDD2473836.1 type IV pilin N-terminal domain-containing protein [Methanoculleus sp.]WOX54900.1 type IV pilin N-terminal domain-containing protein [Methanoculleus palmolei]